MAKYTLELYAQLEKETGQATGFNPIGILEIACSQSRLEEFRRVSAFARYFDVSIEKVSPTEGL
jgi:4-methylaminobutanoate oxidase (formaldehyde-forming)